MLPFLGAARSRFGITSGLKRLFTREIESSPLSPEAQERLRAHYCSGSNGEAIDNYHTFDLPDGTVFRGHYDLRLGWREYLGNFDFKGKRVIEFGPASGFLSLMMEQQGAEVVSMDLPIDKPQDLIGAQTDEYRALQRAGIERIEKFKRSWWHFREMFRSKNKAVYADIYQPPSGLGEFDVGLFASVLLHLQNPYAALQNMSSIIKKTIIIVELDVPDIDELGHLQFMPGGEPWLWWALSANTCSRMLRTLGFETISVTRHSHEYNPYGQSQIVPFFTIVAQRP